MNSFLKILTGPREGLNIPLKDTPIVIGRKKGDIIINDPLISGSHAKIYPTSEGWYIEDLQSTNGTMINSHLQRKAKLYPGIEISIGNSKIVLFEGLSSKNATQIAEDKPVSPKQPEIAWLLEEEKMDLKNGTAGDIINTELRLPPNLRVGIEVIAGDDTGKNFPLNSGSITVGRRYGEIPLSDVEVSRKHAIIELFSRDMIFLRDLFSTNGTFHNGRRISTAKLHNGDTIGLGRSVLRIRIKN